MKDRSPTERADDNGQANLGSPAKSVGDVSFNGRVKQIMSPATVINTHSLKVGSTQIKDMRLFLYSRLQSKLGSNKAQEHTKVKLVNVISQLLIDFAEKL